MAQEDSSPFDTSNSPLSALSGMRVTSTLPPAYSPQDSLDFLGKDQVVDPAAKWEAYAGAALKPATGGFGESMGNALTALSEGRNKEAELRAKYLPLVAQAMLQRQMQAMQLQTNQWKLNQDYNAANTQALTGLLSKREPLMPADVVHALGSAVQRGLSPPEVSHQFLFALQKDAGNPEALRAAITRLSIEGLKEGQGFKAVTPEVSMEGSGDAKVPVNKTPNAGAVPVGQMSGPNTAPVQMQPSPGERIGALFESKDQAGNQVIGNKLTGNVRFANTGSVFGGIPKLGVSGGANGPGAGQATVPPTPPPRAAPPPSLPPAAVGAPQSAGQTNVLGGQAALGDATGVGDGVHPPLKTSTQNEAEKVIGNDAGKYQASLASHVASMRSAQQRLAEMRDLSKGFQPGATAEWRNKAGAYVKDVGTSLGLSPEQADSMASAIAKGDISKAQAFQKLAAQGAMESLKSAMATDNGTQAGRTTQAEFQLFAKNSPNIELDPASLDRMMNFVTRQYQMGSAELQGFTKYYKTGKDLQAWPSIWDEQAKSLGYVSPSVTSGTAKGSAGSATHQRVGVSKSGRAIIETSPGVWEYSDTKKQER